MTSDVVWCYALKISPPDCLMRLLIVIMEMTELALAGGRPVFLMSSSRLMGSIRRE